MPLPGAGSGSGVLLFRVKVVGIKAAQSKLNAFMNSVNQLTGNMTQFGNKMKKGQQSISALGARTRKMNLSAIRLKNALVSTAGRSSSAFHKLGVAGRAAFGKLKTFGGRAASALGMFGRGIRKAKTALTGFRMEMLSVMFVGMMLQKTIMKQLKSVAKMTGIMDIFSSMMKVLLLPIMVKLIPFFMDLLDAVLNMSPGMKKLIGIMALVAGVMGTMLFVGAQIVMLFSIIGMSIFPLITIIGALVGSLGLVGLALGKGKKKGQGFNDLLGNMFEMIGPLVKKLGKFLGDILDKVWDVFENTDWAEVWGYFIDFGTKVYNLLADFLGFAADAIFDWFVSVNWVKAWGKFFNWASNAAIKLADFLGDMFKDMMGWVTNKNWSKFFAKIFEFSLGIKKGIHSFFADIFSSMVDWAGNVDWGDVWDNFFKFTGNIQQALMGFLGRILGTIWRFISNIDWIGMLQSAWDAIAGIGKGGGNVDFLGGAMDAIRGVYEHHAGMIQAFTQGFEQASSAQDFIITNSGQILKTSPRDTIMGTKTPGAMGGAGNTEININDPIIKNDMDIKDVVDQVERELDRRTSGRSL